MIPVRWLQVPTTPALAAMYPGARTFQRQVDDGHLMVIVGHETDPGWVGPKWHLSISHRTNTHPPQPGRYPGWDEITEARYRFIPDSVTVAMLLPPRADYVNHHRTTFHLWEIDSD